MPLPLGFLDKLRNMDRVVVVFQEELENLKVSHHHRRINGGMKLAVINHGTLFQKTLHSIVVSRIDCITKRSFPMILRLVNIRTEFDEEINHVDEVILTILDCKVESPVSFPQDASFTVTHDDGVIRIRIPFLEKLTDTLDVTITQKVQERFR